MSELTRDDYGWVEAGTVLYFEQQPNKSHIPRLGQYFQSFEVVKMEAYATLTAKVEEVERERDELKGKLALSTHDYGVLRERLDIGHKATDARMAQLAASEAWVAKLGEALRKYHVWMQDTLEWCLCYGEKGSCAFCDTEGAKHEPDCCGLEGKALLLETLAALSQDVLPKDKKETKDEPH